jgi:hypothetical protein
VTRSGRRILLAVEPAVLEGALAAMLAAGEGHDIVDTRGARRRPGGDYDAAVVSDALPAGVRAGVVITLPDTQGSGGTGTVRTRGVVHQVSIAGAGRVVELLDEYA